MLFQLMKAFLGMLCFRVVGKGCVHEYGQKKVQVIPKHLSLAPGGLQTPIPPPQAPPTSLLLHPCEAAPREKCVSFTEMLRENLRKMRTTLFWGQNVYKRNHFYFFTF